MKNIKKRTTISDIAAHLGIHKTTVSRALKVVFLKRYR